MAVNPTSTLLALGCEDGSIRILSLEEDGIVPYKKLDRGKTRILCLAWGLPVVNRKIIERLNKDSDPMESGDDSDIDDEDLWKDVNIYAGCSDSSFRKWDVNTGRITDRMTMDKVRGEKTLVWSLAVAAYVFRVTYKIRILMTLM
jgi:U3 small nucleolar RNA-associated protein 4